MLNRHKWTVLIALVLCLALVTGCTIIIPDTNDPASNVQDQATNGKNELNIDNKKDDTESNEEDNTEDAAKTEPEELTMLRNEIRENRCSVGVAFVDYIDNELSEENIAIYLSHTEIAEKYPFVNDADIVAYYGNELFVLVPADKNGVITLYSVDLSDDGEMEINLEVNRDEPVYVGEPGAPVVLRSNIHEGYVNIMASITDGDSVCEYYPMVSLEDGCSAALDEGCYDFSPDNVLKHLDEVYYKLPHDFPEIQEAVDNGRELIYQGELYYNNEMMLRFELGTFNEYGDGFVCEKQYAVSFDATYEMDPVDHEWYIIGPGIDD